LATKPCKDCKYYDVVMGPGSKPTVHGRCAIKSVYPMKEGPGQVFPPGVKRMTVADKPCKPVIVVGHEVQKQCIQYQDK
jgi:hypothetical protein